MTLIEQSEIITTESVQKNYDPDFTNTIIATFEGILAIVIFILNIFAALFFLTIYSLSTRMHTANLCSRSIHQ